MSSNAITSLSAGLFTSLTNLQKLWVTVTSTSVFSNPVITTQTKLGWCKPHCFWNLILPYQPNFDSLNIPLILYSKLISLHLFDHIGKVVFFDLFLLSYFPDCQTNFQPVICGTACLFKILHNEEDKNSELLGDIDLFSDSWQ